MTFSKRCRAQKNRVDIAELLPQLSCPPDSPQNALRTLLGLEDASKSKPKLVLSMFKGMEGRSMHVIGIIENGFNPTKCLEAILGYQLSRSFLVPIAFGNLVLCLSAQMHIAVWLGSEQASCQLSRHAASTSFSNPATDLKAASVSPHSPW